MLRNAFHRGTQCPALEVHEIKFIGITISKRRHGNAGGSLKRENQ